MATEEWVVTIISDFIKKYLIPDYSEYSEYSGSSGSVSVSKEDIFHLSSLDMSSLEKAISATFLHPPEEIELYDLYFFAFLEYYTFEKFPKESEEYYSVMEEYANVSIDSISEVSELSDPESDIQEYISNFDNTLRNPQDSLNLGIDPEFENHQDKKKFIQLFREESNYANNYILDSVSIKDVPQTCFDLVMQDSENIKEYIKETDNFILLTGTIEKKIDAICFSKDYLRNIMNNIYDNYWFGCEKVNGNIEKTEDMFLKLPVQFTVFIPVFQMIKVLKNTGKIYHLEYSGKSFTRSTSFRNAYSTNPNWISGYHCQKNTPMNIHVIKEVILT